MLEIFSRIFLLLLPGINANYYYKEILYTNFTFNSYSEGLMIPSADDFFQAIGIRPQIRSIVLYRSRHGMFQEIEI